VSNPIENRSAIRLVLANDGTRQERAILFSIFAEIDSSLFRIEKGRISTDVFSEGQLAKEVLICLPGSGESNNLCTEEALMSEMGICTKPLARRTLPRVRRSAVIEGLRD
jgi:hypothetical protein